MVMSTPDTARRYTYADYEKLPDDGRQYQVIEGELFVTPAPVPKHQLVAGAIYGEMRAHVRTHGLGVVFVSPIDLMLADDTVVQPDVAFVAADRKDLIGEKFLERAPDLVVEVLSPSTRRIDLVRKRKVYEEHGVREYWVVDPEVDRVEVFVREEGRLVLREEVTEGEVRSLEAVEGLAIPLATVFEAP